MNTSNKLPTHHTYDVIVVGGGHAGIEAAYAAAKRGSRTMLLTLSEQTIGLMPCNPSVGGLGKGHIVYEVAALGGLMPKLCSQTYLQCRMLNTKKGPAVQGLRLQIDKYAYKDAAQEALRQTENLTIHEGMACELLIENKSIAGIKTKAGLTFGAKTVVITAGTFLNGTVHVGLVSHSAGRMGEEAAKGLSQSLAQALGVTLGRLKTGTPPRLLRSSINFEATERQDCHELEFLYEWAPVKTKEKVPCYITGTNETTHQIIRENLGKSAMYSGNISGIGPRYCPSIEDKISRFAGKDSHHVFIEPEGGDNSEVYPGGLSTSLPIEVQEAYIHSIKGFENAIIAKPGYAVEYDFVQPTHLSHSLEAKGVRGLFFAGQINGTTGYEEAAGQGIMAGINASLFAAGEQPFTLSRQESYIGVMIDDLVTLGTDEPYRMFTSRAERRLLLRQDNAFLRLLPYGYELGLIDEQTWQEFCAEKLLLEQCISIVLHAGRRTDLWEVVEHAWLSSEYKEKARELLCAQVGVTKEKLHDRVLLGVHAAVKYDGYLDREIAEVKRALVYQDMVLPAAKDLDGLPGLSIEMQQKLHKYQPKTIAQAQLIPGMTPAAISLLIFRTKQGER